MREITFGLTHRPDQAKLTLTYEGRDFDFEHLDDALGLIRCIALSTILEEMKNG